MPVRQTEVRRVEDRLVNGVPTCLRCGQFSSAQYCFSCSQAPFEFEVDAVYTQKVLLTALGLFAELEPHLPKTLWEHLMEED